VSSNDRASSYEELGVSGKTIVLRKLVFALLTAYPLYSLAGRLLSVKNTSYMYAGLAATALYAIGVYKLSSVIAASAIALAVATLYTAGYTVSPLTALAYVVWVFLAEYAVEFISLEKRAVSRRVKLAYTPLTALIPLGLIGVSVAVALYANNIISGFLNYAVESSNALLRLFYEVVSSTRVGQLALTVLAVFAVFYILDRFVYGILSDTALLSKSAALTRVLEYARSEWSAVLSLREPFTTLYFRVTLFTILYFTYMLLNPLITLVLSTLPVRYNPVLYTVADLAFWLLASALIYAVVSDVLRRALTPSKPRPPKPSLKQFYAFTILAVVYTALLAISSPSDFTAALYRALFPAEPGYAYQGFFAETVQELYLQLSESIESFTYWYFERVCENYNSLAQVLDRVLRFLWG